MNKRFSSISIVLFLCRPSMVLALLVLMCVHPTWAQDTLSSTTRHDRQQSNPHTTKAKTLQNVYVRSEIPSSVATQTPTQVITTKQLKQTGATTASDAVRQLVGITLKDYGGVGGVKTISARGLGSQFSTLTIDGIAVNDCQNGQIDLGRYLLENADHISFTNAQSGLLLQTARSFASGSVLNIQSRRPTFDAHPFRINATFEGGSFGLIAPTLTFDRQIAEKLSISIMANYSQCQGNYPYTLFYSHNVSNSLADSSSKEIRQHSQVRSGALDATLFWDIDNKSQLLTKAHFAQSLHALPGPVIYYNALGSEYTTSQVFFLQSRYRRQLNSLLKLQVIGKYSRNLDTYDDTAARNVSHLVHNEYLQQEEYLSSTLVARPTDNLALSFATDNAHNSLHSNLSQNNEVKRVSSQNVLAVNYQKPTFDLSANLLATLTHEHTNSNLEHHYAKLSPYAGASILITERGSDSAHSASQQLKARYFFKENYRLPNFNELYYFAMTRNLEPEKALQNNFGLTYSLYLPISTTTHKSATISAQATVDGYFNRVSNKIIAIPTNNLFLWSMTNLGEVDIWGVDATAHVSLSILSCSGKPVIISASVNYSLQHALDMTDPTSKTYLQQIPYTPRHSGNATIYLENPLADFSYSAVWVGNRYCTGQNTDNSLVAGYIDQSILIAKQWQIPSGSFKVKFQILNLFDIQYQVVKSYPMMGRNYRIGATYNF